MNTQERNAQPCSHDDHHRTRTAGLDPTADRADAKRTHSNAKPEGVMEQALHPDVATRIDRSERRRDEENDSAYQRKRRTR